MNDVMCDEGVYRTGLATTGLLNIISNTNTILVPCWKGIFHKHFLDMFSNGSMLNLITTSPIYCKAGADTGIHVLSLFST